MLRLAPKITHSDAPPSFISHLSVAIFCSSGLLTRVSFLLLLSFPFILLTFFPSPSFPILSLIFFLSSFLYLFLLPFLLPSVFLSLFLSFSFLPLPLPPFLSLPFPFLSLFSLTFLPFHSFLSFPPPSFLLKIHSLLSCITPSIRALHELHPCRRSHICSHPRSMAVLPPHLTPRRSPLPPPALSVPPAGPPGLPLLPV